MYVQDNNWCHVLEVFLVHLWYPKTFAKGACENDKIYKYSHNYLKVHHENSNVYLPQFNVTITIISW
jgi:hypothetical protein